MPPQNYSGMMGPPPQQGYEGYPSASGSMDHAGAVTASAAGPHYPLPAALLAQFPALAGLQWDQLAAGPEEVEGDISGRSSFDASSGGEFYEEEDGEYGTTNASGVYVTGGWASDYEGGR